jgi:hypothetical protein
VTRVMIKNIKKGIKDEFFESKQGGIGLGFKDTPKNKLLKNHMNLLLNDIMKSDDNDTLDGKMMAHKIDRDKAYFEKQQMCEDPPEFISENGDFNPDILNRSIVDGSVEGNINVNLSDLGNVKDEFNMSQNTPLPYGQTKKGALSNRGSRHGPGNLTSRTHGKGSELDRK